MKKTVLFLLRTYNDIDHIAPVIWKAAVSGWPTYIMFVDQDYSDDYRIRFVLEQGATLLRGRPIFWYDNYLRRFFVFRKIQRICDRIMAYSFGWSVLVRYKIEVTVNEWSGPYGRGRAEYYLRAAVLLNLPIYSLPHGYFVWTNPLVNLDIKKYYDEKGSFPNFENRNLFSKYVVQSKEHKTTNINHGMAAHNLVVMGSARFCSEWSSVNQRLLLLDRDQVINDRTTILFFLPHWNYNVHRELCISLLLRVGNIQSSRLVIKAHTRGTGALSEEEKTLLKVKPGVVFADNETHSPTLVCMADIVINFGSSVGFEALRQGKPVINPTYLHDNGTFFDGSGAVYDVTNERAVIELIQDLQCGTASLIKQTIVDQFLLDRVDGGIDNESVLEDYLSLLDGCY